jgi:hypothetical protein
MVEGPIDGFSWTVIIVPPRQPTIEVQPAPQSVVEPTPATFVVGATGRRSRACSSSSGDATASAITGANGASYTTGPTSVAADDGAVYSVDVGNAGGTTSSAGAILTVTTAPVTTATLNVTVTPANSGTVTSAPAGIDCGADCTETYPLNTAVALTATPAAGFAFSAWSANCPAGAVDRQHGDRLHGHLRGGDAALERTRPHRRRRPLLVGRRYRRRAVFLGQRRRQPARQRPARRQSKHRRAVRDPHRRPFARRGPGVPRHRRPQRRHRLGLGYRGNVDCAVGSVASTPFKVDYAIDIVAASAGYDHTLLLRNDGRVLAFGCNHSGQLGRPGLRRR